MNPVVNYTKTLQLPLTFQPIKHFKDKTDAAVNFTVKVPLTLQFVFFW